MKRRYLVDSDDETETKVVDVHVCNLRPKYDNLKKWMKDSDNIYIGRAGVIFVEDDEGKKRRFPEESSPFANPYKVGKDGTREEVINKFEIYIKERLNKEPELRKQLLNLKGKKLGCWCKPEACHGDVLVKLVNLN